MKLRAIVAGVAATLGLLVAAPAAHAATPTITSISPNSGSANTNVVITGTNFGPIVTSVTFGGVTAAFSTQSTTQVTAIAPPGSGTVEVKVTTNEGTSNGASFTFGTGGDGGTTTPPPPPAKVSFGPGDSITSDGGPPAGSWCTVTAVGYDDLDNLVAITAGHCTTRPNQHQEVYISGNGSLGPIGTYETINTIWPGFPSSQFPADSSRDYAVIKLDPTKITPRNTTPNGTKINRLPVQPLVIGQDIMCKYGQVTATTCGVVMDYWNNTIRSWASIFPGDSGGPVTVADTSTSDPTDGYWVGLTSAINPVYIPPSQFTGVWGILADIAQQGPNTVGIGFEPLP